MVRIWQLMPSSSLQGQCTYAVHKRTAGLNSGCNHTLEVPGIGNLEQKGHEFKTALVMLHDSVSPPPKKIERGSIKHCVVVPIPYVNLTHEISHVRVQA